jgi:hypothetical protein
MAGISDDVENLRVNRSDFVNALDDVHPAFGVSEEELQQVVQNGIIHYNGTVDVRRSFLQPPFEAYYRNLGTSPNGSTLRRTSPFVNPHPPGQYSPSRAAKFGKNCPGSHYCPGIAIPFRQVDFA